MTARHDGFRAELPVVLSIAGSDCGGGAGIQADIKTCAEFGVYCATAITAVTAQNPCGVRGVGYVGGDMLRKQLDSIIASVTPDAVKIGMIPCAEAVGIIADFISGNGLRNVVIDTVVRATSGGSLTGDSRLTADASIQRLFPAATLITPNIPELFYLTEEPEEPEQACCAEAALSLMRKSGANAVLVKGGHSSLPECQDILFTSDGSSRTFTAPRIETDHTHGTGCTLSSAIACGLAAGLTLEELIARAKAFITEAIAWGRRFRVFPHNGPLCHFYRNIQEPTK